MVRVQKTTNNQLILTIPRLIAEFKGVNKGTEVVFKDHKKDSLILEIVRNSKV
ncbi:hypothetical protein J4401_05305 [Candidatus Woesearchaeota archaeon]|nr:hypothetical protein [Candidatus Woesearchaeota archaeon]